MRSARWRASGAGSPAALAAWAGVGGAILAGLGTAALHALVTVRWRADQIVSGLALNLLAAGLTKFLLTLAFGSASNSTRITGLRVWEIPGLAAWSPTRTLVCTPLVLLALLLGPTGNLRAPTLRKGRTLLVGFDEASYAKALK